MKPLKNIQVLDLSRVLAGPLCAQTLGDLGAEVIKIETPGDGDESRTWPPFYEGTATAYIATNRNKKSITVNLKAREGQEILHALVKKADVVIESAATGVSARLAADYDTLRKINPKLVYCTISGFGRSGPFRDKRGYDVILQAHSGMMSITGDEGSGVIRIPFSPIDQTTGHHAAMGVLAALLDRAATGRGSLVEVSLLDTAVNFLGYMLQAYAADGKLPTRNGSCHPGIAPYQAFEAADKPVLIGVANDKLWRNFCMLYGIDSLAADRRFATNRARVENREEVVGIVQEIVKDIPAERLLADLENAGIPCAPINSLADILVDPQVQEREIVQFFEGDGKLAKMKAVTMPIIFNNLPRELGSPPPELGEHNVQVLGNLGYSPEEIERLATSGVIGEII